MPYVVVTGWYPTDIEKEITPKYLEMVKQYPFDRSLGKETIPVAISTNKKGVKALAVIASKRMVFLQSIKGWEYKIRVWSTIGEALELTGISSPG
jgi:hypothetical protein